MNPSLWSEVGECTRAPAPGNFPGFGVTKLDVLTPGPSSGRASPLRATQARPGSHLYPSLSPRPQPQFCPLTAFIPVSTPNASPTQELVPNSSAEHLGQAPDEERRNLGSRAVQVEGALEGKGPWARSGLPSGCQNVTSGSPYRRKTWHVPAVRLEGPAEARSLSTALMVGMGAWASFWGVCSRPDESRRGEFYISSTCNLIH